MASFIEEKMWLGIPYGFWIVLDYAEAQRFSGPSATQAVDAVIGSIGTVWAAAAAIAVEAQMTYIYELNEKSNYRGVELLFVPVLGIIVCVHTRSQPQQ